MAEKNQKAQHAFKNEATIIGKVISAVFTKKSVLLTLANGSPRQGSGPVSFVNAVAVRVPYQTLSQVFQDLQPLTKRTTDGSKESTSKKSSDSPAKEMAESLIDQIYGNFFCISGHFQGKRDELSFSCECIASSIIKFEDVAPFFDAQEQETVVSSMERKTTTLANEAPISLLSEWEMFGRIIRIKINNSSALVTLQYNQQPDREIQGTTGQKRMYTDSVPVRVQTKTILNLIRNIDGKDLTDEEKYNLILKNGIYYKMSGHIQGIASQSTGSNGSSIGIELVANNVRPISGPPSSPVQGNNDGDK